MHPSRASLRVGASAAALAALLLTGCTPAEPSAPASSGPEASGSAPSSAAQTSSAPAARSVEGDRATVVDVVDGDTVDVRRGSEQVRVRLLNVDTPETKHPNKAVECKGPEATALLEELLRPGDEVVLQYDVDRTDRYDRTLAGVFEGETLVNAEIARAGLGVPVVFEPNRRFYDEVVEAWEEAEAKGVGLKEPGLACTLPAMTQPVEQGDAPVEELAAAYAVAVSGDQPWMKVLYGPDLSRVKRVLDTAKASNGGATSGGSSSSGGDAWSGSSDTGASTSGDSASDGATSDGRPTAEAAGGGTASETSSTGSAGGTYFGSCDEAEVAGAAPLHRGEAGYRSALDSDGDGTACEPYVGGGSSGGGSSAGGGSGSTSNKAPNRCYAPGGGSYTYCDDQGSSDSGLSGAAGFVGSAGGGGGGGPVSGSGGVCPDGYPVKVSSSNKYHVPGGQYYDKTSAKNCYASAAAAEAAGAVASKR